jgi:hypothetical protein
MLLSPQFNDAFVPLEPANTETKLVGGMPGFYLFENLCPSIPRARAGERGRRLIFEHVYRRINVPLRPRWWPHACLPPSLSAPKLSRPLAARTTPC